MPRPSTTRARARNEKQTAAVVPRPRVDGESRVAKSRGGAARSREDHVLVVGVAGGSGAGKSWLADRLLEAFPDRALRLRIDDFYRDLSHLPMGRRERVNFDRPQAIDWDSFRATLSQLIAGRAAEIPVYDFATHTRRPGTVTVESKPLLLVEGLWPWWTAGLRALYGLRIYVACPESLRKDRRLERDQAERGRTPDAITRQLAEQVFPLHARFVEPQRAWADRVLQSPITGENLAALTADIRALLGDHGKK